MLFAKAPLGVSSLEDSSTIGLRFWDANRGAPNREMAGNATYWSVVDNFWLEPSVCANSCRFGQGVGYVRVFREERAMERRTEDDMQYYKFSLIRGTAGQFDPQVQVGP